MNKLVIVGNGFDLAHDLPTSYSDFLNNFWFNFEENRNNENVKILFELNPGFDGYSGFGGNKPKSYKEFVQNATSYAKSYGYSISPSGMPFSIWTPQTHIFRFKNDFFRVICENSVENWVEIENIYYDLLISIINGKNRYEYYSDIKILNAEFETIKILLEEYLQKEILAKYDFSKNPADKNEIINLFRIRSRQLSENPDSEVFLEYLAEDHNYLIEFDNNIAELQSSETYYKPIPNSISWQESLFVDFNYTKTTSFYVNQINSLNKKEYGTASVIKIHGEIGSKNRINFGFGDEMDDQYKIIENKRDNNYLKNIKSFQYLHNSNYRKLLNWIETNKFQVYIFGHSCGLSDRTLLNTIFENSNCRSIKIFYHQREHSDNFTELTHNISRHFNKKPLMRSKIVDFERSISLPQTIRFNKKS